MAAFWHRIVSLLGEDLAADSGLNHVVAPQVVLEQHPPPVAAR
jgi:hypothetical protein